MTYEVRRREIERCYEKMDVLLKDHERFLDFLAIKPIVMRQQELSWMRRK